MEPISNHIALINSETPMLFTIPDAGRYLRISRSAIYRLVGIGDLKTVHIGRSVRITRSALDSFIVKLEE